MIVYFSFFLKNIPFYFIIVITVWILGNQVLRCSNIQFFFSYERGPRYDLSLFIDMVFKASYMAYLFFPGAQA
jgi:hypothetical protein